jgi:hypothetical protein
LGYSEIVIPKQNLVLLLAAMLRTGHTSKRVNHAWSEIDYA